MTKNEFIQHVLTERAAWEQQLKGINFTPSADPADTGAMGLRDLLYHVAWYEREMLEMLQLRAVAGSPWWELPTDERNARILKEGGSVSLQEAYRQEEQVYARLLAEFKKLTDEELEQAHHFRHMPPEWHPWEVIASNTYEHYPQHLRDLTQYHTGLEGHEGEGK
jgi:hypothetical protein